MRKRYQETEVVMLVFSSGSDCRDRVVSEVSILNYVNKNIQSLQERQTDWVITINTLITALTAVLSILLLNIAHLFGAEAFMKTKYTQSLILA